MKGLLDIVFLPFRKEPEVSATGRHIAFSTISASATLASAARVLALGTTFFLTTTALISPSAFGQDALLSSKFKANEKAPMLIQADELVFDNKTNSVRAEGNVEIYYNGYTLVADKVVYDKSRNRLLAEGNVRIKEPDGAIVNADKIELTDDFKEGFISSLKVVTADDARIAALNATRVDGNTTVFEKGVFTPCKACKEDPDKPPVWQIKAMKIIHDKAAQTIYYEHASLEFLGVPIAYVPFFSSPDPTVKQKTGFLAPSFGHSSDLGFIVETPYHIALADNYDFTFRPVTMSAKGVMLKGTWRHRLANGKYHINMAGVHQSQKEDDGDPTITSPTERNFRGSIDSIGNFSLGSFWDFGWDITVETDDEFRRFYKIDSIRQTDRVSRVYMEGMSERNYIVANLYHFGGLVVDDDLTSNSQAKPVIDYNYIFSDPVLGGELSFDANLLSLTRSDAQGTDTSRAIIDVKWRKSIIDSLGQVFTPFASARGDIYKSENVVDVTDPTAPVTIEKQTFTRGMLTAGMEYRYPLVSHTTNASHIVEPIAQVITRSNASNQRTRPNEDAMSLVFDDTLLFDIDKFSGYDRIETGTRANIGVQYTLQINGGGYARAVVGQSYHLSGNNAFAESPVTSPSVGVYETPDNGLETDQSDYVAGLYVEPNANFSLVAQGRFDQNSLSLRRTDILARALYGPLTLRANYVKENNISTDNQLEEILSSGTLKLTDTWSLLGGIRYNIEDDFIVTNSVGLKYADECFMFAVNYAETFTSSNDINADQSIMFKFELKQLGGFSVGSNQVNDVLFDESSK